ncbi:hypothetical protein [Chryseobacterium sp.]|uniref:hypothetical protein n=1 Tax=Chryseobacterium sp. TaxID=1871047 RepID=UPI0025BD9D4C|nr:hypothetical protein [Chryseobacterium sp.]
MVARKNPFLDTLFQLRKEEQITIFSDIQAISLQQEEEVNEYMETEFEKERLEFLSDKIPYDRISGIWAAKILYHSMQLYLIRRDTEKQLPQLIPEYKGGKEISSLLSADLSLRFLPPILTALYITDPNDPLAGMLEAILLKFHYSGIGYDLDLQHINWEEELEDPTFRKLYIERIVEKRAYQLAEIPYINQLLIAEFGIHKEIFWRELKNSNEENNK